MSNGLTAVQVKEWKRRIDVMSQVELARLLRFAPCGHPIFSSDGPLYDYFTNRFTNLGGMTPEISKVIGWGAVHE